VQVRRCLSLCATMRALSTTLPPPIHPFTSRFLFPHSSFSPSLPFPPLPQALVHSMDLTGGPEGELLKPEELGNPTLQRFYLAIGRLTLGFEEVPGKEDEVGVA
jgi:hypothetical protein